MKRLFIAIPFQAKENFIREWNEIKKLLIGENIKWIPEKNLHLTLKFLGETPDEKVPELAKIIDQCFHYVKPKLIYWNKIGIFGSKYKPKVIWLGCKEEDYIKELYQNLKNNLEAEGFVYDRQNFVPHISLSRLKSPINKEKLENMVNSYRDVEIQRSEINEIVLMESILKPKGAEYKILHRKKMS